MESSTCSRGNRRLAALVAVGVLSTVCAPAGAEPAPPTLHLGDTSSASLRLAAPTGNVDQTFVLVSGADGASLKDISVRVELSDADKRLWPVTCTLSGQACGIKLPTADSQATLRLVADLPTLGPYVASISVTSASPQTAGSFAVTFDRALTPIGLAVAGVDPKIGEYCPLPRCESSVHLWFSLQETAGREIDLREPQVVGLAFKGSSEAKYQSEFDMRLFDEHGKELKGPIKLGPGETRRVALEIEDIDAAGNYTGRVRWSAAGTTSIDTDFSAVVREPWSVAFLAILAGVLVGEIMRRYRRRTVPRQAAQRELLVSARRSLLNEDSSAPEWQARVNEKLRVRVEEALDDISDGGTFDRALIDQLALARTWGEMRTAVLTLPGQSRTAFEAPLDGAEQALLAPPEKKAIDAASQAINAIADAVRTALRDAAKAGISALLKSVDQLAKSTPSIDASELAKVKAALTQAESKIAANELSAAKVFYDQAASGYSRIVAAVLDVALKTQPTGFIADPTWEDLTVVTEERIRRIYAATDAGAAISAQAEARKTWIRGLVDGLVEIVKTKNSASPALTKTSEALGRAMTALDADDLDSAEREYLQAQEAFRSFKDDAGFQGPQTPSASPAPPLHLANLSAIAAPRKRRGKKTLGDLWRSFRWKSSVLAWAFFFASALIATLSGLQVLWVTDATWGGWGSRVLALFWGLGLHQVSGAIVQGVEDVQSKMDGSAAS